MNKNSTVSDRWFLDSDQGIRWDVVAELVPHVDEIEMAGRRVAIIVRYGVNADGSLNLSRRVIWPQLRTIPNNTHASLRMSYKLEDSTPLIFMDGIRIGAENPAYFRLNGCLTIQSRTQEGLMISRVIFPSPRKAAGLENWTVTNQSGKSISLQISPLQKTDYGRGTKGVYILEVRHNSPSQVRLEPGQSHHFGVTFSGRTAAEPRFDLDSFDEESARRSFIGSLDGALRFECPDPILSRAFTFAKRRTAESIYDTLSGLMHSPGGDAYYAAVWCNDQCEYANPFFPFLGDPAGNESALNSYRLYRPFMAPAYDKIPSSIVAEGTDIWEGVGDRGDAAMYAYGAARYALALGDRSTAEELFPLIAWCLEYCRRQTTPDGVVASDSDELEGRFSHGKTNLATSCLTYGGLLSAADLARALEQDLQAIEYDQRALEMALAIERVFGARVQGYETYRYHEGLDQLRSWICLPLVMGLPERRNGTVAALFSPELWTEDGLLTDAGKRTFWDRSTLYGFRGVFFAGETEKALSYFQAYSHRRLLGEHVPYPVEAYPEGNQRHLAAESALYCRVVTEGLFGIIPCGLSSFRCLARLPRDWDQMALRSVRAFGYDFDLEVKRGGSGLHLSVWIGGKCVLETCVQEGVQATFKFP